MSCSALARRAFARLDIDPAKGREMALHGARAWNDLPANFSFDPEGGEGAGFLVGAYACAGTGGSDLLITLSLPEEALALEGKGKGRKALALVYWLLARQLLRERGDIPPDGDLQVPVEEFEAKLSEIR